MFLMHTVQSVPYLFIIHSHFQLEYDDNCGRDTLCVYGVYFCGSWLSGRTYKYFIHPYSNFTLGFYSDDTSDDDSDDSSDDLESPAGFQVKYLIFEELQNNFMVQSLGHVMLVF